MPSSSLLLGHSAVARMLVVVTVSCAFHAPHAPPPLALGVVFPVRGSTLWISGVSGWSECLRFRLQQQQQQRTDLHVCTRHEHRLALADRGTCECSSRCPPMHHGCLRQCSLHPADRSACQRLLFLSWVRPPPSSPPLVALRPAACNPALIKSS